MLIIGHYCCFRNKVGGFIIYLMRYISQLARESVGVVLAFTSVKTNISEIFAPNQCVGVYPQEDA